MQTPTLMILDIAGTAVIVPADCVRFSCDWIHVVTRDREWLWSGLRAFCRVRELPELIVFVVEP